MTIKKLDIPGPKARAILERERPWIELLYPEDYTLSHGWLSDAKPPGLSIPTAKYQDLDPAARERLRTAWNRLALINPERGQAFACELLERRRAFG